MTETSILYYYRWVILRYMYINSHIFLVELMFYVNIFKSKILHFKEAKYYNDSLVHFQA